MGSPARPPGLRLHPPPCGPPVSGLRAPPPPRVSLPPWAPPPGRGLPAPLRVPMPCVRRAAAAGGALPPGQLQPMVRAPARRDGGCGGCGGPGQGRSQPSGPDLRPRPPAPAPSVCEKGALLCEPGGCPVPCGWSAWSSWGPCDRSCGSGLRARFRCAGRGEMEAEGIGRRGGERRASGGRGGAGSGVHAASLLRSPSNPPAASGGAPCEGQRQELQACYSACGSGESPPASVLQIPARRARLGRACCSLCWVVSPGWSAKPPIQEAPWVEMKAWRGAGGGARCLTAGWGHEAGPGGRDGKRGLAQDLLEPRTVALLPCLGAPRAIPAGVSGSFVPRRPRRV